MPPTTVDKLLRGLEDLSSLSVDDLDNHIASLEADAKVIQVKLSTLRLVRTAIAAVDDGERGHEQLPAPLPSRPPEPSVPRSDGGERPSTWKSDAVLEVLRENADRTFTPSEVRDELRKQGVIHDDEGTATSVVLRRLVKRGRASVHNGRYGLQAPDPIWRDG